MSKFNIYLMGMLFYFFSLDSHAGSECSGKDYCVYGQMPLYNQSSYQIQSGIYTYFGTYNYNNCVPTAMTMIEQGYAREYNVTGNANWGDLRWIDPGAMTGMNARASGMNSSGTRFDHAGSVLHSFASNAGGTIYEAGGSFNLLEVNMRSNINNTFRNKKAASLLGVCVGSDCTDFWGDLIHPCYQGRCHALALHGVTGGANIAFDPWGSVVYLWQGGNTLYHGGGWGFVSHYGGAAMFSSSTSFYRADQVQKTCTFTRFGYQCY